MGAHPFLSTSISFFSLFFFFPYLDLAIFATPTPRARLFVRPPGRHKESPGFAGEIVECVQRRF